MDGSKNGMTLLKGSNYSYGIVEVINNVALM